MTEEKLNVEEKKEECKCFCRSEGVKKFVIVAAGTFVGVFCALSLFAALHKPPMMPPCPYGSPFMRPAIHQGHHFNGPMRGDFHKKMIKGGNFDKPIPAENGPRSPFEAPNPERR